METIPSKVIGLQGLRVHFIDLPILADSTWSKTCGYRDKMRSCENRIIVKNKWWRVRHFGGGGASFPDRELSLGSFSFDSFPRCWRLTCRPLKVLIRRLRDQGLLPAKGPEGIDQGSTSRQHDLPARQLEAFVEVGDGETSEKTRESARKNTDRAREKVPKACGLIGTDFQHTWTRRWIHNVLRSKF